jgi:hypothetical protein
MKARKEKRRQRFLPLAIGTTGGVALAAVAFWFFKKQAEQVVEGKADRYDMMVFDVVHKIDNPAMHTLMETITQLGSHVVIGTAAGVTALAMLRHGHQHDPQEHFSARATTGGGATNHASEVAQLPERTFIVVRGDLPDRCASSCTAPIDGHAGRRA